MKKLLSILLLSTTLISCAGLNHNIGNQELFDSLKLRYFEAIGGEDKKQLTDLNQKHQKDIVLHTAHYLKAAFPNKN